MKIIENISELSLPQQINIRHKLMKYKPKFLSETVFIMDFSKEIEYILLENEVFEFEEYK